MAKTIVYVDGFNLYHRQLERRPVCRWLNVKALAERLLGSQNQISEVKYYTARASGAVDPGTPKRQQVYLDALETVPEVSIFFGQFLRNRKWAGLVHPPEFRPITPFEDLSSNIFRVMVHKFCVQNIFSSKVWPKVVKVWRTEEKGSDVKLASHLIRDGFVGAYDVAAVVSNDSDLVEPIRIVTSELGKPVGLITPVSKPNPELLQAATFVRHIRISDLKACQFPDPIVRNPEPPLSKPATWV